MRSFAVFSTLLVCAFCVAPAAAQRVFDNFDRTQGVQVFLPPPTIVAKAEPKRKRGKNGKWRVVVEDKLVQKTANSRWTVSVTDGLAAREGQPLGVVPSKIAMGSNGNLKGFTTGNMLHDA